MSEQPRKFDVGFLEIFGVIAPLTFIVVLAFLFDRVIFLTLAAVPLTIAAIIAFRRRS